MFIILNIALRGDDCSTIMEQYGLDPAKFQLWNSQIDSNCTNIYPGKSYCVSKPDVECATYHRGNYIEIATLYLRLEKNINDL